MNSKELAVWLSRTFDEVSAMRSAGQKEYARDDDNAFANFERTASHLGLSREEVLLVFAMKHLDGITAYVQGHKSQREDVRGRITDLITYMCLLRAMIEESEENPLVLNGDNLEHS